MQNIQKHNGFLMFFGNGTTALILGLSASPSGTSQTQDARSSAITKKH
jgi:hypothetical protein